MLRLLTCIGTTIVLVTLDLTTKYFATTLLTTPLGWPYFGLSLAHNPAIAFGIPVPQPLIVGISIIALAAFGYLFARKTTPSRLTTLAFGLLLGGALGNLAERLFDGTVTDFFVLAGIPNFNLADTFLTFAVILFIVFHDRIFLSSHRA